MRVNYPFFPSVRRNEIAYYCGEITHDDDSLQITIKKTNTIRGAYTPFASMDSIDISKLEELVQKCSETTKSSGKETCNAVITQHYLKVRKIGKTIDVYFYIIYESILGSESNKGGTYYMNVIEADIDENKKACVIILSRRIYDKPVKTIRIHHVERQERGQGKIANGKVVNVEPPIECDKIETKALIVDIPYLVSKEDVKNVVKLDLLEVLVGTQVYYKPIYITPHRYTLIHYIIPTPTLSRYFYFKKDEKEGKTSKEVTSLDSVASTLILPSAIYPEIGAFLLKLDLTDLYNKLVEFLYQKIARAKKLLEEISSIKPMKYLNLDCEEPKSGSLEVEGREVELYPESVLKALTNNMILTNFIRLIVNPIDENLRNEINSIRSDIRLPHRILRIDTPISPIDIGLMLIDSDLTLETLENLYIANLYIAFEVVGDRIKFLKELLKLYGELLKSASQNYDAIDLLIAAFIRLLDDMFEKKARKLKIELNRKLVISCRKLAYRLAIPLLEIGLHAISHLLVKYLSRYLRVPEYTLREIVILGIGGEYIKNRAWLAGYYFNNIVNGFLYRLVIGGSNVKGYIIVADTKPFSYGRMCDALKDFNISEFVEFSLNVLGRNSSEDRCYRTWLSERQRLENYLNVSVIKGELSELENELEELGIGSSSPVGGLLKPPQGIWYLSVPTLDARPIYHELIRKIAEKHEKDRKIVERELRPYLNALYITKRPWCFDGCYNCVLIEKSCMSHPLIRDWSVSKSVARLIISTLKT